jgi:hypothetical protein
VRAGGDKDCGNTEDEGGRGRGKAWASNRAAMVPGVCGQGLFTSVGVEGRRGSGCASPVPQLFDGSRRWVDAGLGTRWRLRNGRLGTTCWRQWMDRAAQSLTASLPQPRLPSLAGSFLPRFQFLALSALLAAPSQPTPASALPVSVPAPALIGRRAAWF